MSRSYRKVPKRGIGADSDKKSKRYANRSYRRAVREALHRGNEVMPELREVSDVWDFEKDGKMRLDPVRDRKSMRK